MSGPRVAHLATLAAVVAAACTFLGWAASGRSVRSSYGLFQAAGRAGLLPESVEQLGLLFFFVPAVAGAGVIAAGLGRGRLAATLALVVGLATITAALLVVLSPLSVRFPVMIAGFAGVLAAGASVVVLAAPTDRQVRDR
ncbi:MAG TPA: hypothetical protein VMW08_11505 [Acidimicrobiales bacterium]|nr:hypothetical protein [Acidimicrobiales bacterium]